MATADDVAAAVMDRIHETTAMKLEKLVYYCQCWHLARHGVPMFDESIEAWREGPVVPALYQKHKGQREITSWPSGRAANLTVEEDKTVDWVVEKYNTFSAIELSRMTHFELPWRLARGDLPESASSTTPIRLDVMKNFYGRQRADVETAVSSAVSSAALEGTEIGTEWEERLRDVASGVVSADDLIAREIAGLDGV